MFEKAKSFSVRHDASSRGFAAENGGEQSAAPLVRRAGEALRAMEWSELTARLNAARDLRLLLRSESQGRIEAVAASFGDAAASYFAMIEDNEPAINLYALDGSKALGGMESARVVIQHDAASGGDAERVVDAPGGDAREEQ